MHEIFRRVSDHISFVTGTAWAFMAAFGIIIVWAITGPLFHFSDTWQLVINTGTTIVTFLMVFLIQNTQNRDAVATQIKLDELIRSQKGARNTMMNVEEISDDELQKLQNEFHKLHKKYEAEFLRRQSRRKPQTTKKK